MDDDYLDRWMRGRLREQLQDDERLDLAVTELTAQLDELLTLLIGNGVLVEGHRKHLARAALTARRARQGEAHRHRLNLIPDKYALESPDVDCAALLPLCRARCCALTFALSAQDLDEGVVKFELGDPFRIRHDPDGYCSHIDRKTLGCTVHDKRPGPCRSYDCREDGRIWLDFANRIPAPPASGLTPLPAPERPAGAPPASPAAPPPEDG